jgi:FkbM family methyltransferase
MTLPRWLKDLRSWVFYGLITKRRLDLVTLGDTCQWTICDDGLDADSRVLCAGAGNDISFEKALITSYGCKVVLLDPSPTGTATVQRENLSGENLKFLPIGLAGVDDVIEFEEPRDPKEGSFVGNPKFNSAAHKFRCQTPSALMSELAWRHIDLLKIDIEGFEYQVIQHILQKGLSVKQICVEFHHGDPFPYRREDTIRAILALRKGGYDLVHRSSWDHTFIQRRLITV